MQSLFILIIGAIAALIIIMLIAYKALYKKIPPDSALVVSGGKETKVYFGGKIVNPLTCRTQEVSLNTMNLKIEREGTEALITKDSLRCDIAAEFFVRIEKEESDVLDAAASLGEKTQTPENVKMLLEGKLVGALRAVAATMELQELHEQRQEFQDAVQEACRDDLKRNGFTLETVSITGLDQTPLEQLDENNRFDAVAIRTINEKVLMEKQQTEKTKVETDLKIEEEERRQEKESARLQAEASIAVEERKNEAAKQKLELERDLAFSKAEQEQAVREAEIKKSQAIEEAEIRQKRAVDIERIEQEREVQEAEIQQRETIEKAKIQQERAIEESKIGQQKAIEEATISKNIALVEKRRQQEEAEAESAIKIAMKIKESELAEKEKLIATAEKAKAEEQVHTAQATEEAEREARVKLIAAEKKAEEEYVAKQKIAEAEAYEITKKAEAELEAAKLKAESTRMLAEAELEKMKAEAEGEKVMIEAKNLAEERILIQEPVLEFVKQLPEITERLMKPAEKIESIRVLDMSGLTGNNAGEGGTANKITNAILNTGAAIPMLKEVLKFSDVDADELIKKATDYMSGLKKANVTQESNPQKESSPREIAKVEAEYVPQKENTESDVQKVPEE